MKTINTLLILSVASVIVFLEAAFNTRRLLGAQIDLLPALIVYTSLTGGLSMVALVSVCSGLAFDSLSANPLGITILPLFAVGFAIHFKRDLILRDQAFAQFVIGLAASAAVPLLTLLLLFSGGQSPILGWGTVWQCFVMSVAGGLLTPMSFRFFKFVRRSFFHRPVLQTTFRADREIRRGRR